ncbi:MAG: sulfotransferase [Planctomycetota bacterium]|nr:sulfotransferase [Planctomycetota bacterium]
MRAPDFLIVGAMKAGTSTLSHFLSRNPRIYMARRELHFFDRDENFEKGMGWYSRHFESAESEQLVGEKTPTYSFLPLAAERIAEVVPDAKLIWIFREPVVRAYSNYWHAVKNGAEPYSFERAVELERQGQERSLWNYYLKRSRYAEQIRRFCKWFSLDQMLFLQFERLVSDPHQEVRRVCSFLGVEEGDAPESPGKNRTYVPRSRKLARFVRVSFGRGKIFRLVARFNRRAEPGYPAMDASLRESLKRDFEKPNLELAELTGLDLTNWQ